MGKWKDRRNSRRRYDPERYMYQVRAYYPEIDGPGASPDNVPRWEKDFCMSVGCVPWRKILYTQKFMFGHDNVFSWDDSAGEEVFKNAKARFRARINGSHCDISHTDPDTYIERINWDPYIDPELVKDLDRVFFNPDEVNKDASNGSVSDFSAKLPENRSNDNPWESKSTEHREDLRDETWGPKNPDEVIKDGATGLLSTKWPNPHSDKDPWESQITEDMASNCKWGANNSDEVKKGGSRWVSSAKWPDSRGDDNPWESKSTERHRDLRDTALSCNCGASNPWEQNNRVNVQKNDKLWEQSHNSWGGGSELSSWGRNKGNPRNMQNCGSSYTNNSERGFGNERRWREASGSSGFRRHQPEQPGNRIGAWNGGCRKRDNSHVNVPSGYNDDYRDRGNTHSNRGRDCILVVLVFSAWLVKQQHCLMLKNEDSLSILFISTSIHNSCNIKRRRATLLFSGCFA